VKYLYPLSDCPFAVLSYLYPKQKPPVRDGRLLVLLGLHGFVRAGFRQPELCSNRGVGFVRVGKCGIGGELEVDALRGDLSHQTLRLSVGLGGGALCLGSTGIPHR
jgi:hypothetical protein